jgi:hypothetical protein
MWPFCIVFVHLVWGYPPKAGLDKWNGVKIVSNSLNLRKCVKEF